jgi:hypothetical protein
MIRHPFTAAELGVDDESLAATAGLLERYAEQAQVSVSPAQLASILDAIEAEPTPRRGWLAALAARGDVLHRATAMAVAAGVLVAAVGIGFLLGRLAEGPAPSVGTSPSPSVVSSPTPTTSPSPTPSVSPTPSPTSSPSGSALPSVTPTAEASASDAASESAEPSASGSDDSGGNSGPGGGGSGSDDSSGPGGGG